MRIKTSVCLCETGGLKMKKKKDGKVKLPALHSEHRLHLCVSDVSLLSQAAVKVCVKVCVNVCVCVCVLPHLCQVHSITFP